MLFRSCFRVFNEAVMLCEVIVSCEDHYSIYLSIPNISVVFILSCDSAGSIVALRKNNKK